MRTTQRWTLAVVCLATAMLMLDIAVVNTALSDIQSDLDTDLHGLQWVVDAYTLALATAVLTAGSLADRFGRRRLFLGGLVLFTISSLACAMAQDITTLHIARAVQGVGGAILFAVSLAILANAFPDIRQRTNALAMYGATVGASFAVGPLVGGALTSGLDWRWIFLVNLPFGIAGIAITLRYVRESLDPRARKVDVPGQLALTGGLFLLVFALLRGNEDGWGSTHIVGGLLAAGALLVAFLAIEHRVAEPMLPLRYFRNRAFTGAQIGAFAISASFFAVFLYATIYLQQVLGLSAIEAGLVYLPGTVIMFLVAGATASMADRVAARTMISGGLLLVAIGQALLLCIGPDSSWIITLPGTLVALIGSGLFNPSLSAVALGSVPEHQAGVAAGVNDTFRQAGIAVGVAALGALVPASDAFGGSKADYVSGLHDALLVCVALCAIGALATWKLIPRGRAWAAGSTDGDVVAIPAVEPAPERALAEVA